jgi:glycine cleavage system transcriptional repressor
MKNNLQLLVVLGEDRPGIIASVTKALYEAKCNLEDASMTILEGELAMFLVVRLKPAARHRISKILPELSRRSGLTCFLKDLQGKRRRGEIHPDNSETYLVTAFGKDQTGIVCRISSILSAFKLNITDLNSRILGQGRKSVYALALEVDIPHKFSIARLDAKLQSLARKLKVEIRLRPVERIQA